LAVEGPNGELTPIPGPVAGPFQRLTFRSQHFGLPASTSGAEATEDPKYVTTGTSEPCYASATGHRQSHKKKQKQVKSVARRGL